MTVLTEENCWREHWLETRHIFWRQYAHFINCYPLCKVETPTAAWATMGLGEMCLMIFKMSLRDEFFHHSSSFSVNSRICYWNVPNNFNEEETHCYHLLLPGPKSSWADIYQLSWVRLPSLLPPSVCGLKLSLVSPFSMVHKVGGLL